MFPVKANKPKNEQHHKYRSRTIEYFKTMKQILNTLGLYDLSDTYPSINYIKYAIIVSFLLATFLTSFHFVLRNSTDLQKTSTALFAANIMFISSIYFTMLFSQKKALRMLLDRVEVLATLRKCE